MKKVKFNDNWRFLRNGAGDPFHQTGNVGEVVRLPHDASILTDRNPDEPNGHGNGFFREQNYVYTKEFVLSDYDAAVSDTSKVYLEFEGVYQNAYFYINGSFAGNHAYGYGNYYIDATRFLDFDGKNQIKVVVKNAVPSGRWYTGGGIYRDVNIMICNRTHIDADSVFFSTINVESDSLAVINVKATVENSDIKTKDLVLKAALMDGEQSVTENNITFTLSEGETNDYSFRLYLKNPKLWDSESPFLYNYKVSLCDFDGNEIDAETGTFGVRTMTLDPFNGLRINGNTVKLKGCCIHHDNGITGTAEFPFTAEYRVKRLKEFGFNAIRSSHYPMSRHLLNACDKYGVYVMDEFADVWTSTKVDFDYGFNMSRDFDYDVRNLVKKDYNHPSVIMFSIGNEIPESANRFDLSYGKKIADIIKTMDPTRYTVNSLNIMLCVLNDINNVMVEVAVKAGMDPAVLGTPEGDLEINSLMNEMGDFMDIAASTSIADKAIERACDQVDIAGYNYAAGRYEMDKELHPNRVIVGSETFPKDLDKNWELVEKIPSLIGDFDWTGWDYLGEAGIGQIRYDKEIGDSFYAPYPAKAAYCGDINLIGDPRPIAFWRKMIWDDTPSTYIAVQPPKYYSFKHNMTSWTMTNALSSWTYKGYENSPVKVEVYSNGDEVELLVNGLSVGRQSVPQTPAKNAISPRKYQVVFDTKYVPGEIKAVSYRDGQIIDTTILQTANDDLHLETKTVSPDSGLFEEGGDIEYIDVYLVDSNGVLNADEASARMVTYSIEGDAKVVGFGSADPDSEENYYDKMAKTFEGRLRLAIRKTGTGGYKATVSMPDHC